MKASAFSAARSALTTAFHAPIARMTGPARSYRTPGSGSRSSRLSASKSARISAGGRPARRTGITSGGSGAPQRRRQHGGDGERQPQPRDNRRVDEQRGEGESHDHSGGDGPVVADQQVLPKRQEGRDIVHWDAPPALPAVTRRRTRRAPSQRTCVRL